MEKSLSITNHFGRNPIRGGIPASDNRLMNMRMFMNMGIWNVILNCVVESFNILISNIKIPREIIK